jgi:transcriptional regulator with XRE-family HTH domain
MLFCEKLIQCRKERGMTQENLADRLCVSRQTVSKWENGDCMPDADKFIRLSDILEISLDELAGREVEVEPIVLPAPELPHPEKKLRRILIAAVICLLVGAAGFLLGRYAFPRTTASAVQKQPLSDTLTVSGFSMTGRQASFIANAAVDGTVYLFGQSQDPLKLPAIYDNGVFTVSEIPAGRYEKLVLVVSDGAQERSGVVITNLEVTETGASWVS